MLRLAAAVVGFLVTFPPFWPRAATDGRFEFAMSLQPVQNASAQPSGLAIPRLVVHTRGIAGEPLPLGLTIEGSADGAVVIVTGLLPGMTLSSGNAVDASVWQVPATDLANTWVGPPKDFVGMVNLTAELHLADATARHRQPIRMEWVAAGSAVATQVPAATPMPNPVPAPQHLTQDEIDASKNLTATIKPDGGRTDQKRVARKANGATSSKKPVKAFARPRGHDAAPDSNQQDDVRQANQPTQAQDDHAAGRPSQNGQDILEFILPRRRSEQNEDTPAVNQVPGGALPPSQATDLLSQDGMSVAAIPSNRGTQEASHEPAPEHMIQHKCDYRGCASAYRSFRASDCTYQPPGGRRRVCELGARPTEVSKRTSRVSIETRSQQCHLDVCVRFYRSFNPSDCTFQPLDGGARKSCNR
jgi:hypothetical protein